MRAFVVCLVWTLTLACAASAQELSSDTLRLRLGVTSEGIPIIKEAVWQATGQVAFRDLGTSDGLSAWVPASLIPATPGEPATWSITEGENLTTAEATLELVNKMRITWIIDLPKQGQLFRLRVRLTNGSKKARLVDWFPAWSARWDVGGPSQWARWWKPLEFDRTEQALTPNRTIRLGSRLHSSDDGAGGVNPYWIVAGPLGRVYFGLQWSGGWTARLDGLDNGFGFAVKLPAEETQLVLSKREAIEGPALLVTPVAGTDDAEARALWMRQRRALARTLYSVPPISFPLSYNHWYAVRGQVDADFLAHQVAAMGPYGFDAFILDAGWFADGRWKPDPIKFPSGEITQTFAAFKASGIKPGLWSTPQYVSQINNSVGLTLEDPVVMSRFLGGSLVDLSQDSFTDYFTGHVQTLRRKYSMDYWKYDQPLFTEQTRAGEMKNVVGFQHGLEKVRQANPDLFIENCLNGGRMINDFTLLATQTSWLMDYGKSGIPDPQANLQSALNALEIVFPWAALRFTINFEQIDPNDDEMTRLCCRSAMIGMWGISTDLALVSPRQQNVILKEIANYRRLNPMKFSCVYDLQLPSDAADTVGVTFYSGKRRHAGILCYRWQREGAFDQRVTPAKLKPEVTYRVTDADGGPEITASGSDLMNNGINISFSAQRQSALIFIEPVENTPAQ
jgi:Melibiase